MLEIDLIEKAKEKFLQSANLSRWKEKRDNESCRLLEKMFKAYKRAELLREKKRLHVVKIRRQRDDE